jgi:hypothetical protein
MMGDMAQKHRLRLVLAAYKLRFMRLPNLIEQSYWVNFLRHGNSLKDMLVAISQMSAETFTQETVMLQFISKYHPEWKYEYLHQDLIDKNSHSTNLKFIDAVFVEILGRHSNAQDGDTYVQALEKAGDRSEIVRCIASSPEAFVRRREYSRLTEHAGCIYKYIETHCALKAVS